MHLLSAISGPPSSREIARNSFDKNRALSILHVPENTRLVGNLPLGSNLFSEMLDHRYNNDWPKMIKREEEFKLHRTCRSFYPRVQGIGSFHKKNNVGIT